MITNDADQSAVEAGQLITYTLRYRNIGERLATGVVITEQVPAHTTFVSGSPTGQWSCSAHTNGPNVCRLNIGTLPVNGSGTVSFTVRIDTLLDPSVTSLVNIATIADDGTHGVDPTPSNNRADAWISVHPTSITLLAFNGTPRGGAIVIRWETGTELNTAGFYILRSRDGVGATATRVSPLIERQGRGTTGASYEFIDNTVDANVRYTYWLQEIEQDGTLVNYPDLIEVAVVNAASCIPTNRRPVSINRNPGVRSIPGRKEIEA